MTSLRPIALTAAWAIALLATAADARPLIYSGALTDADDAPITTPFELEFSFLGADDAAHDAAEGAPIIVEATPDARGAFTVEISTEGVSAETLRDAGWLGVRVRTAPDAPWEAFPPPHQPIGQVPRAAWCDDVEGAIHPDQVFIGAREVITPDGLWVGDLALDEAQVAQLTPSSDAVADELLADPTRAAALVDRLLADDRLAAAIAARLEASAPFVGDVADGLAASAPFVGDVVDGLAASEPLVSDVVDELDTPELVADLAQQIGVPGVHFERRDITVCPADHPSGPCDFTTVPDALAALDGKLFRRPAEAVERRPQCWVQILISGHHPLAESLRIDHPQGENLCIRGVADAQGSARLTFPAGTDGIAITDGRALGELRELEIFGPDDYAGWPTRGISSTEGAHIVIGNNVSVRRFNTGVIAERAGRVVHSQIAGGAPLQISEVTVGVAVKTGGWVQAHGAQVTDTGQDGFYASSNGYLIADYATAARCASSGFRAMGGRIDALGARSTDNASGFVAERGGYLLATNGAATCNDTDVVASTGAVVYADGVESDSFLPPPEPIFGRVHHQRVPDGGPFCQ